MIFRGCEQHDCAVTPEIGEVTMERGAGRGRCAHQEVSHIRSILNPNLIKTSTFLALKEWVLM